MKNCVLVVLLVGLLTFSWFAYEKIEEGRQEGVRKENAQLRVELQKKDAIIQKLQQAPLQVSGEEEEVGR